MPGATGTNPGRAWKNLVMQPPKPQPTTGTIPNPPYACYMKGMRVVPGDASKSIVYSKLIGMPICGANAPEGAPDGGMETWMRLSDAELCMWKTWINAGAQMN
jgi:hypothetical protein